jgi:hypothetical protein
MSKRSGGKGGGSSAGNGRGGLGSGADVATAATAAEAAQPGQLFSCVAQRVAGLKRITQVTIVGCSVSVTSPC